VGKQEAFRSLTLLVAVCEQALLELEAAHVNLSADLATKIEATRDAAVETIATFRKPLASFGGWKVTEEGLTKRVKRVWQKSRGGVGSETNEGLGDDPSLTGPQRSAPR